MIIRRSIRSFWLHLHFYYLATTRLDLYNKSASLSYYTVISLFPMALFITALMGYILPAEKILASLPNILSEMMPLHSDLVMTNLEALFKYKAGFTSFGLISLFLSAQMLYVNMEKIINRILHIEKNRHFLITRAFFLLWLASMVFVLFTPVIFELLHLMIQSIGWGLSLYASISSKGGFMLVSFLMFVLVLLILPTQRISFRRICWGGFYFAVTLQLGKLLFKWMTLNSLDRYNLIYGSLSSIVLGLLWIFYFYNMFLFFVYWVGQGNDPAYAQKMTRLNAESLLSPLEHD